MIAAVQHSFTVVLLKKAPKPFPSTASVSALKAQQEISKIGLLFLRDSPSPTVLVFVLIVEIAIQQRPGVTPWLHLTTANIFAFSLTLICNLSISGVPLKDNGKAPFFHPFFWRYISFFFAWLMPHLSYESLFYHIRTQWSFSFRAADNLWNWWSSLS